MKPLGKVLVLAGGLLFVLYWLRRQFVARLLRLPAVRYRAVVQKNLRIPMPDGVTLAADHYAPAADGDFPTVLIRSPYGRRSQAGPFGLLLEFVGWRFAERGYHVLIQDTRGRFDSEGEFSPYFQEKDDGLATLDWMNRQPWFNGVVGLWGGSYLGIAQWLLAVDAPPVKAILPSITASDLRPVMYPDNALDLGLAMRWLAIFRTLDDPRGRSLLFAWRMPSRIERSVQPVTRLLPLNQADKALLNQQVDFYQEWLQYADPDATRWREARQRTCPERVDAPVHLLGGWYDFFLRPLLDDYARLRDAGHRPYLTIGPWHHFSQILSLHDLREGIAWFDAHLKGDAQRLRDKPVHFYVMGANEWRQTDSWPPPSNPGSYYLRAGRLLSRQPSPLEQSTDCYHYDPADPTPMIGGAQFSFRAGPRDNRQLEARPDVLTFTTPALRQAVEVIGPVLLVLYVKSSLEHADFFGRLCDVYPNGRSVNVCEGLFRVAPGRGQRQPDGSLRIEVDMRATAYRFQPGHAIRLQVSSGAHPRWNRNLGTGEPLATATTMLAADQVIYHDRHHPSALVLPVSLAPESAGQV